MINNRSRRFRDLHTWIMEPAGNWFIIHIQMLNDSFSSGNVLCPYKCAGARMTIPLWIAAVLEWIYSLDCGKKDSIRLPPHRNAKLAQLSTWLINSQAVGRWLRIWKDVHGRHSPWEEILLKKGKEREYKTCSDLKRIERVFLNLVLRWMWEIGRVYSNTKRNPAPFALLPLPLIPNTWARTRSSLSLKCPPDDKMQSWPGVPEEEMLCRKEVATCDLFSSKILEL